MGLATRGAAALVAAGLALLVWAPGIAAAGLGAALFAVGAALWPLAGLCGVVAALPLYLLPRQLGGIALSPPELTLVLCTLVVGLRAIADRLRGRSEARLPPTSPFDAPIALLLAAALLSLLVTEYLRLSLRDLRTLIVEPVLFFYLLRYLARTPEDLARVLDVLLAATTAVALLAIGQFFFGPILGGVTDVQGVRRVLGTYSSPNHLALLLGRVLPFLLAGAWLRPRSRRPRLVASAVCAVALALTFSLGGWLATATASLALVGIVGGRRPLAIGAAGTLALGLVVLVALPMERIAGRLDPTQGTALVRVQLWQASLRMLAEQPLLGIGLDTFLYRYPSYIPPGVAVEPNLSHPHNLVLQFWLQLGLLGLVALLWLLAVFVRRAWRAAGRGRPPLERALAAGALASMVDFVAHGLIDNSYFLVDMAFIFWLTIAVSSQLSAISHQPSAIGGVSSRAERGIF